MVTQITQKEYRAHRALQKKDYLQPTGIVMMRLSDGNYYKSDQLRMMGTKELMEYDKSLKGQLRLL